ncbi:MAG: DUF1016 domain-containing protein [Candidatus Altiarchaeum hamiconexum]|uniref:DUF1016 domain-containing protein n=1 Tax=Candidatus Altarchaeum hamiconexum TaxID=1803513 RepID=A0A8J7YZR8_9ARCH|nr:DUF1016 domain-containing protein [Candidatus Altarchaeum hamiconexum]NCN68280.1 DUF1016 domain-containing protein [Candidatus Altarchaeum hamiconexum]NCS90966.1 DUF1016 domain-containing protein [Candidatus Altarchaeum hamiconexum]
MKKTGRENYLMNKTEESRGLFDEISGLIEQARRKVASAINGEMVVIMKSDSAKYGKQIVQSLTAQLTQQYGRGFSVQNLWHSVKFHETYQILSAVQREFSGLNGHIR